MSNKETFLTREGYEKLKEELNYLKTVRRREIAKQLAEARAQGDLTENAEYEVAKEEQTLLEIRIQQLESQLSRVRIIDEENIPVDKVYVGTTVLLKDLKNDKELKYTLVGPAEANPSQGKISTTSPVGQGLLKREEGETVEIKVPAGVLKYKILKIWK